MTRNNILPELVKPPGMERKPYRHKPKEWKKIFLDALTITGNVRAACVKANINRNDAYLMRAKDEVFRQQWEDAIQNAIDSLELVAWDRARKLSDTLLMFLLKAHRPEVYRERSVRLEHTGADGAPIQIEHSGSVDMQIDLTVLTDDELLSLQTLMHKVGASSVAGLLGSGSDDVIDGEYTSDDDSNSD